MKERRALIEGLKFVSDVDRSLEEAFVYEDKNKQPKATTPDKPSAPKEAREGKGPSSTAGRAPLTVRFRTDYATALKRASLERQLNGIEPFHLQDILEEAVEPWLRSNGYLN